MPVKHDSIKGSLAIVILSFDGYKDVWPYFFSAFNKYWPDCVYPVYLVNNEADVNYNVNVINVGKETTWCDRAKKAIDQIDSDYILLLLEDYLIGTKVENSEVEKAMSFIIENNAKYFRITNIPKKRAKAQIDYEIYPIEENEEYGINLQASIWKKDFLLSTLNEVEGSAWNYEIHFLKQAINANTSDSLNGCFVSTTKIIDIHNGILKGKWFPKTIKYFKKKGIIIDYEYRGKLSINEVIRYNVRFQLRENMPYNLRKTTKKILRKLGVKFVSEY